MIGESFTEQLLSLPSVPERLKSSGLPVYLYGIGDGADKVLAYLEEHGISPQGVFASEGFLRDGERFHSFPVESLDAVEQREGRVAALLCFGTEGEEAENLLRPLMERHLLLVPSLPVYGDGMLDRERLQARRSDAERVYRWFTDDLSCELFREVLAFQMTGDPAYLFSHWEADYASPPDAFYAHDGLHLDVGAHDGTTANMYLACNPRCKGVWAFEPDEASFRKLCSGTDGSRVRCLRSACGNRDGNASLSAGRGRGTHLGCGEEVSICKLDTVCSHPTIGAQGGEKIGSLHIDAEGADAEVLYGGANLITTCRPAIGVAAYHRAEDLLDLPLLLKRLCYRSELYFRKSPCVPAWDTEFYLIPNQERTNIW